MDDVTKAEVWDEGWEARAAIDGPACPDDHNPYRNTVKVGDVGVLRVEDDDYDLSKDFDYLPVKVLGVDVNSWSDDLYLLPLVDRRDTKGRMEFYFPQKHFVKVPV